MIQATLAHTLDRTVLIQAGRDVVFRFFTDPVRWAGWWGVGSSIEPHPGGRVFIRYPDGTEAAGEVLEITEPSRLVFSYGYVTGAPIPEGGSLVTIDVVEEGGASRVRLSHAFAEAGVRDNHLQGWRYQLSLFANAVAHHAHGGAPAAVDGWFTAWSETDAAARAVSLRAITTPGVSMRDQFSAVEGIDELLAQLTAVHTFMPGMSLRRDGALRQCQGVALADWVALAADGSERSRGTNIFTLAPDGRIAAVTGFWGRGSAA
jgi:uncharacterized protein YndB with AHSA1/START domain